MEQKTIQKTITINATKEKVWQVLLEDAFTRQWYAEFSPGTRADTDWKPGSKALFTDESGDGLATKVAKHEPQRLLELTFEGMVNKGVEDYDSDLARSLKGGRESYATTGEDGAIELAIAVDMIAEMFDSMSASWDRALLKLKALAEGDTAM